MEDKALVSREPWAQAMDCSAVVYYELQAYRASTKIQDHHISSQETLTVTLKMAPRSGTRKRTRTRTTPATATTSMTDVAIRVLIAQGVADALAGRTIQRNTNLNDDGSQGSGSGITRPVRPTRECTYSDFLKCQPINFKGTKGVVGLTQWFKRIETVFHISNYTVENQVKFATCTLHGVALTWWNSHVKTVGHDAAYGNVMSKPKTIEEAIKMENNLMDQKLCTLAERQIENKRKQDDDSRNKRHYTGRAYTAQKKRQKIGRASCWACEKREFMVDLCLNYSKVQTYHIMVNVHQSVTSEHGWPHG
ncbi:hypothetical protein Tco_1449281 [Tanacetum coccineum]